MQRWKTLARQKVLDHPPFLTVEMHSVELPDGRVIRDWAWLITPDFVNVLAVTSDGQFLVFRQTKYALSGETLAVVGGFLETGETPEAAARRELLEETGYAAPELISLGSYVVDPNRGVARAHFFLAKGVIRTGTRNTDELEEQELLLMSRAEMEAALTENRFGTVAWTALVALGLRLAA